MGDQDHAYKVLFAQERMVEDLLRGFIPARQAEALDFTSLEQVRASFVGKDTSGRTRVRKNDLVWKIRLKEGGQIFVYLMLEFQSTVDRWMALRVLTYTSLLLQDLVRNGEVAPGGRLPTVLPFVIYSGTPVWTAPVEVADLFAPVPGMESFLKGFRPRLKYFLIDEGRLTESALARPGNVAAALFRVERSEDPAEVRKLVSDLAEDLTGVENRGLRESISLWLLQVLSPKHGPEVAVQFTRNLEDPSTMLRDAAQRWWDEVRQEGRRQGKRQGQAAIVLKLLQLKFGALDAATKTRVRKAEPKELERWAQRLLTSDRLDQVFS